MTDGPHIAEVAALIGDPARANMLSALKDEGTVTASELALVAGVTPQTASGHLAKLAKAGLVAVERRGRHRFYRLAGSGVAEVLEALMGLSVAAAPRRRSSGPRDPGLRFARTCYDHLAGRLGVALAWSLVEQGCLEGVERGFALTPRGERRVSRFGLDMADLRSRRRPLTRSCLDWSERRPHLGGALGAAILGRAEALGWIARSARGRAVLVTDLGRDGFKATFGLDPDAA